MPAPLDYLSVDWGSSALVVIDFQRDFADDGPHPIPGTSAVAPAVCRLVDSFRAARRPIAHVVRLYSPGGTDVDLVRRQAVQAGAVMVAPGSAGSQVIAGVLPEDVRLDPDLLLTGRPQPVAPREAVFFKPRWSAFHRTGLQAWLTDQGVTSLVVAGCNLPNCPRATLFDASSNDYRAALVVDAVSQATDARLQDLSLIGIQLVTTPDAAAALAQLA